VPDLDSLTNQLFDRREAMRPTLRTWLKHFALLLAAFFTVTIAGVLYPFGFINIIPDGDPQSWAEIFQFLFALPAFYLSLISNTIFRLFSDFKTLQYGISFSASLLAILTAHEAGHYVACRLYKVDATLPYFIPLPPLIGPAGTLGAFIKIVSPMPSRRAVFDIGVAGPIAGFIALIPVLIFGLLTMRQVSPETAAAAAQNGLIFADPLLSQILARFIGVNLSLGTFNPFLAAAWVGMLVTSLNLIPSGQLDGGHAIYSIFGERIHLWTGRIAFAVMSVISLLGWFLYSSPSGFLFAVLLAVMMRIEHPEPLDYTPLNFTRKIIAVLTLIIFILCFVPFPIRIM